MNNSTTAPSSPQQTVSSEPLDRDPASRNSIQALHKNLAKQHFANFATDAKAITTDQLC